MLVVMYAPMLCLNVHIHLSLNTAEILTNKPEDVLKLRLHTPFQIKWSEFQLCLHTCTHLTFL